MPTLGATPTVAWQLHRQGWHPHYLTPWPFTEDADHLWAGTAPEGSETVFITDSAEPELAKGIPATAQLVGTVPMDHREGELGIYRDLGD